MTLVGRYSPRVSDRRRWAETAFGRFALAGLLAGMLAKWMDEGGPAAIGAVGSWLAWLMSLLGVWVFAIAMVSRTSPSPLQAAFRSSTLLLAMCLGYYGFSQAVYGFSGIRLLELWSALAVTVVPLLAWALRWAVGRRHGSPARAAAAALVEAVPLSVLLAEAAYLFTTPADGMGPAVIDLALAGIVAWLLPADSRSRGAMLVAAVPVTAVAWLAWADFPSIFGALLTLT